MTQFLALLVTPTTSNSSCEFRRGLAPHGARAGGQKMKSRIGSVALALGLLALWTSVAQAVTTCKTKVNAKNGTIDVSAGGVSGTLTWGDRPGGPYPNSFFNGATCIVGTSATKCELGAPGSPEALIPPDLCTFYLKDSGTECAAYVRNCTPGARPTTQAKADALKELVNAISFHHSIPTIEFSGVNVQIDSGSGSTDGPVNGSGNLIIGYDELIGVGDDRTGSHNLIVGAKNNYSSYGGIVAGNYNSVTGSFASVLGGFVNVASGDDAVVSGGYYNTASGQYAAVSGGNNNEAQALWSSVSGGDANIASGQSASVCGGVLGTASGAGASVSGGRYNIASGYQASVSGGFVNEASGQMSSVSGTDYRNAVADYSWVTGSLTQ